MAAPRFPISVPIIGEDRLTAPLSRAGRALGAFGSKARQVGKSLTVGLTAPLAAAGALVIGVGANFQSSMNRVAALTGEVATPALEEMRAEAKRLGAQTAFSASQAADAMGNMALSGFHAGEIMAGTTTVLDLASAAQMELARTAEIASGILKGQRLEAAQLGDVSDILTATFTSSATALEDLSEGMKKAGPVARGMNIPLAEQLAIMGKLGDNMFRGGIAGTVMKGALSKLSLAFKEGGTEQSKLLASMGIFRDDILDSDGNVKSLIGTIELLGEKGITSGRLLALFGEIVGPGMVALLGVGADSLREYQTTLENATGRTAEIAAIQMSGATGAVLGLKAATEALGISIGESGLLQWFTDIVVGATDLLRQAAALDPKLLRIATVVGLVAAAVGPALIVIGFLATGIGAVVTAAGFVVPALVAIGTVLTGTVIPAVVAFTAALLTNPIGLIAVGITAAIAGLVLLAKNWDTVRSKLVGGILAIRDVFGSVLGWIGRQVNKVLEILPDWLVKVLTGTNPILGLVSAAGGASVPTPAIAGAADAAAAVAAPQFARVQVDFRNVPRGVTVSADPDSDADLRLDVGRNMEP